MDLDSWRSTGARVSLLGRQAFVRSQGAGPSLLFLHGFPTTSFDYAAVIERLAKTHRCVAFDFAGFGESDPPARYDYDAQTALTLAVATHERVDRAVVVAHDYGVSVAQELLARGPGAPLHVEGVVFLNGGLNPALHRALPVQRLMAGPLGRLLGPLVRRSAFVRSMRRVLVRTERFDFDAHWRAVCARGAQRRTHALLHYIAERRRRAARWVPAFTGARIPIGMAWGVRDPISGGHVLEWARAARPDLDILALDVGHYPQVEAPDEVAAYIERFAAQARRLGPT